MDWLVFVVAGAHLFASPFTKVEESFNIQACHDILYHGMNLNEYDHLEFSGVVPRTFLGPLTVSVVSLPFVLVIRLLELSKLWSQYVVRLALALLVLLAWRRFRKAVQVRWGSSVAFWFTLITVSQFHFLYYLSRPIPNTFALVLALLAFSYWLEQRHGPMIISSGVAVLIFRSELSVLLGPMILFDLATRKLNILTFLRHAFPAGILCLFITVGIDSVFWGRLLWPEGEVFWFNTYQNQSHNWGTFPLLWYWYSALPRALCTSYFLVPIGMALDTKVRTLSAPAFLFVLLYSMLPHKELRFIIYVIPLMNVAAAKVCHIIWSDRHKSAIRQLLAAGAACHVAANIVFTLLLLTISANNYPGGVAMLRLHQLVPPDTAVHVHTGNLAAQTGVTRFTQMNDQWRYNKSEHLRAGGHELRSFTHLLVEAKTKYSYNMKHYTNSHEVLATIDAFSHLSFNYLHFPPVKVRVKPSIFILKNLLEKDIDWSFLSEGLEERNGREKEERDEDQEDETDGEYEVERDMLGETQSTERDDEVSGFPDEMKELSIEDLGIHLNEDKKVNAVSEMEIKEEDLIAGNQHEFVWKDESHKMQNDVEYDEAKLPKVEL